MLSRTLALSAIGLLAQFISPVAAQVTTDCNPMNATCPADAAFGTNHNFNFNATPSAALWESIAGTVTYTADKGAAFTINKQGESPTLRSKFYFFFGRTEVHLKVATGTGIISSMMWLSNVLDEVDLEWFGTNATYVQTNYFGKGNPQFTNGAYFPVSGKSVHDDYHNYTTVWTSSSLQWYVDGALVRTLLPKDANNTRNYPQTPMRLSLGIWAGGDPRMPEGTRDWAGGDTDFSKGPFTMYVKSCQVTDFSTGKEYSYGDRSGSWESIKITSGNSTAFETLNPVPTETISEKFNNLPPTTKTAIYASGAGVGAALIAFGLFYIIRQRRRGAREAKIAAAKYDKEQAEIADLRRRGIDPDSFVEEGSEYNAKELTKEGMINRDSYSVPGTPVTAAAAVPGNNKNRWDANGSDPASAMRSPMPLLRDGSQSPRVASPGPAGHYTSNDVQLDRLQGSRSPAHLVSPLRTPSPGMPPNFPPPASPQHRSATTPNAYSRMGSPGPQQAFAGRTQSPAPMAPPNRSYSAPRDNQGFGGNQGYNGNQNYGNRGGYNQGDGANGYWNNRGGF